jgi:2-oxoglutarate dehydrogenase E2 component (dihydrolipoamide succinyltransferase)
LVEFLDILVPKWGLTEDFTIVEWLVALGARVTAGELLVVLDSGKAAGEVESPGSGVLSEICLLPGAQVRPGDVLGRLLVS